MNQQLPVSIVKLLERIEHQVIEKFGTRSEFFFHIGWNPTTGSRVLNGYSFLSDRERTVWAAALDLPESIFPVPLYRIQGRSKQIVGWSDHREGQGFSRMVGDDD